MHKDSTRFSSCVSADNACASRVSKIVPIMTNDPICGARGGSGTDVGSQRIISKLGLLAASALLGASFLVAPAVNAQPISDIIKDTLENTDSRGHIGTEVRIFPENPRFDGQDESTFSPSVFLEPRIIYHSDNKRHYINFVPFARWDNDDDNRTHADIRELSYSYLGDWFDVRFGISKVFWGVAESSNPVDVINQTDLVDDPISGDAKLGQPMVNFSVPTSFGTVELYVMSGFRERTFPDATARFRGPVPIEDDDAEFESAAENWAMDYAGRYSHTFGPVDLGVSHFYGTNREPRLTLDTRASGPVFVPNYDRIHQTGVDVRALLGDLIVKGEGIYRNGDLDDFFAAVVGGEYTIYEIFRAGGHGVDLSLLAEYLYDGRETVGFDQPFLFNNDVYGGMRMAFNDTNDTVLLLSSVVDVETGVTGVSFEAERRVLVYFTGEFEARFIVSAADTAVEENFSDDGFVALRLKYNF